MGATHHFALALDLGAVFLWRWDAADVFTDPATCAGAPGIECFQDSPSNCSLHDAFLTGEGFKPDTVEVGSGNAGEAFGNPGFHRVPKAFKWMWADAGQPEEEGADTGAKDPRAYWYKTQVVAYLARFKKATVQALHAQRVSASNFVAASWPQRPRNIISAPKVSLGRMT